MHSAFVCLCCVAGVTIVGNAASCNRKNASFAVRLDQFIKSKESDSMGEMIKQICDFHVKTHSKNDHL